MSPGGRRCRRPSLRNQLCPGGFSILLHHKLNYLFRCDARRGAERRRDAEQSWAHILPGPTWLHFITAKETQQENGRKGRGTTFDFAKMPKVCAKMHKTFSQPLVRASWGSRQSGVKEWPGVGRPIPKLQQKCTTAADNQRWGQTTTTTTIATATLRIRSGAPLEKRDRNPARARVMDPNEISNSNVVASQRWALLHPPNRERKKRKQRTSRTCKPHSPLFVFECVLLKSHTAHRSPLNFQALIWRAENRREKIAQCWPGQKKRTFAANLCNLAKRQTHHGCMSVELACIHNDESESESVSKTVSAGDGRRRHFDEPRRGGDKTSTTGHN